jgi:hypothetical protein
MKSEQDAVEDKELGMHQFQLIGSPSDTGSIEFAESRLIILTTSQSGSRIPSGTGYPQTRLGIDKMINLDSTNSMEPVALGDPVN